MNINDAQLKELVEQVVRQVVQQLDAPVPSASGGKGDWGVFDDMNDAVEAAYEAFQSFKTRSVQCRKKITDAVRQMTLDESVDAREILSRYHGPR